MNLKLSDMLRTPVSPTAEVMSSSRTMVDFVFEEEPVPLTTFVQDRKFLYNPRLSDLQYEAVRYVEQIYMPDLYPHMVAEFGDYWTPVPMINFADLMWGKGGGKDHVCRIMSLRIAYLLLCLRNPQKYYELPPQDTIHMLNVASSSGQAQQAFFNPLKRAVKRGWFADKAEPKLVLISYDKHIESISGHSDAESQEGLNLILGIADEIDAFKSNDEMRFRAQQQRKPTNSAEAILEMMQTSASTRFPEIYKNVRISYPRYLGSKIMLLRDEGELEAKEDPDFFQPGEKRWVGNGHYVSGPFATWEVNPRVPGKHSFDRDYKKDPVLARAKYECQPASAIDPYFRDEDAVKMCMRPEGETITPEYFQGAFTSAANGAPLIGWTVRHTFDPALFGVPGAQYALHADIGIAHDRCGVAIAHVARWIDETRQLVDKEGGVHEETIQVPIVKVDAVFSYHADDRAEPPRQVQIRWVRQLVEDLRTVGIQIMSASYDQYQSTESIQLLTEQGIEAKRVSSDRDPSLYTNLRDMTYSQTVSMPYRALLLKELLSLQRLPNGKIDHPPNGSKDEADAVACAVHGAIELGGAEMDDDDERVYLAEPDFDVIGQIPEQITSWHQDDSWWEEGSRV